MMPYRLIVVVLLVSLVGFAGCSARQVYEGVRASNRNECLQLPFPQQQECLENVDVSYEEYQKRRTDGAAD